LSVKELFGSGFSWPEAPRWHNGELYISDMYAGRIIRGSLDGKREVFLDLSGRETLDGAPLVLIGTGFLPDGRLLINSMFERVTLVWDGEKAEVYADLRELSQGPINDMVVDSNGRAYVTQLGFDLWKGEEPKDSPIIVIEPGGKAHLLEGAGDFGGANGIVLTEDERTLITAENTGLRISAIDLDLDGQVRGRRAIAEVPSIAPGVGPDGIAVDEQGGVWYALPGSQTVVYLDPAGQPTQSITIPYEHGIATAVALAGEDRRTLVIVAGYEVMDAEKSVRESLGRVWTAQVPVGGGTTRP